MNFLHNPSWLQDLPDAPVVDSPDTLRMRAEHDHRVTLPIPIDVKSFFSAKHTWAVAFQYYRCTGGVWIKAPSFENKFSGFDYTRVSSSKRSKHRCACTLCRTEYGRESEDGAKSGCFRTGTSLGSGSSLRLRKGPVQNLAGRGGFHPALEAGLLGALPGSHAVFGCPGQA